MLFLMTAEVVSVPREAVRGLLRREYDALVETGLLDDEPVELIEGDLVRMMPQKPAHSGTVRRVDRALRSQLPPGWALSAQFPLAAGDRSEPEPDLAVVVDDDYLDHHPTSASLVVEVSRSSLAIDLGVKARVYAAVGVPDYWVLDVVGNRLHAHRGPTAGGYEQVMIHERGTVTTTGEPLLTLDLDAVLGSR